MKIAETNSSIVLLLLFLMAIFSTARNTAQTREIDLPNLLQKVMDNSRVTAWHFAREYSSSFKKTVETEGKKTKQTSEVFESFCPGDGKRCVKVLIEKDEQRLSQNVIEKNRKKVARELKKFDDGTPEIDLTAAATTNSHGAAFQVNSVYLEPNLYLKLCEINFLENTTIDKRSLIKLKFNNCKIENEPSVYKKQIEHMPKTKGFIWIDAEDKAIVKIEAYALKDLTEASNQEEPVILIEHVRVPEGYWFWKRIRLESINNKTIFPELKGNWQIDFFDYLHYEVRGKRVSSTNTR